MSKRKGAEPTLGRYFRELRERRDLGLRQAVLIAQNRGLSKLTLNILGALERGETKSARPDVLKEVAALYEVEYDTLVFGYVKKRYRLPDESDLVRHGDHGSFSAADSQPQREVSHVVSVGAASSRVQSVNAALVQTLENVVAQLSVALAEAKGEPVHAESARTRTAQPHVRKRAGGHR